MQDPHVKDLETCCKNDSRILKNSTDQSSHRSHIVPVNKGFSVAEEATTAVDSFEKTHRRREQQLRSCVRL